MSDKGLAVESDAIWNEERRVPYNIHIVKTSDFVRLGAQGKIDLPRSHDVLAGLAKACIDRGIDCALIDVRDLQADLSTTDLYTLARAFQEMGFRQYHRLAMLHRYDGEKAELFATFAADRGWNVRAFDNYEEAIAWFSAALPVEGTGMRAP